MALTAPQIHKDGLITIFHFKVKLTHWLILEAFMLDIMVPRYCNSGLIPQIRLWCRITATKIQSHNEHSVGWAISASAASTPKKKTGRVDGGDVALLWMDLSDEGGCVHTEESASSCPDWS